jgi:hypothetical protein
MPVVPKFERTEQSTYKFWNEVTCGYKELSDCYRILILASGIACYDTPSIAAIDLPTHFWTLSAPK